MAKKVYEEKNIAAIADKIREKSGVSTTFKTSEMPAAIDRVYSKGYNDRFEEVQNDVDNAFQGGYTIGYDEGLNTGTKSEYNRFWNNYKLSSSDATCKFAGVGWNNETFRPNADLSFDNCYMLFRMSQIKGDLVEILRNLGVTLSTSNASTLIYAFSYTKFTRIGEIDARKSTTLNYMFDNSKDLAKIDKLILKNDGSNVFSNTFAGCNSLEELDIEGVIGNDINFSDCPLGYHSICIIMSCLSNSTSGKTVTFSKAAVDRAFESEYSANDGTESEDWNEVKNSKPNWQIKLV